MSYDVFFMKYRNGETVNEGTDQVRAVLEPYINEEDPSVGFLTLGVDEEGRADVYLSDGSMMVNEVSGEETWDLLVQAAKAADWVIQPPDGPTCLTDQGQQQHLPAHFAEDTVLVGDGGDLIDALGLV